MELIQELGTDTLLKFIGACIAIYLAPGLDTMFIVSNGVAGGARVGLASALGVAVGTCIHVIAAVLGLTLIIKTYPILYDAIKYTGAAYLAYLAVLAWKNKSDNTFNKYGETRIMVAFRRGILSNLLNPKVAIFVFAFLPQFIPAESHNYSLSFALLGLVFVLGTLIFDGAAGVLSGYARETIVKWLRNTAYLNKFSAIVLMIICVHVLAIA